MKPVKQKIKHLPHLKQYGDCHRACIVSILELDYDTVPHFADGWPSGVEFEKRERDFLLLLGLVPIRIAFAGNLDDILYTVGTMNPNTYYILGGKTVVGTGHSVVGLNDKIVHDPNDAGIVRPFDDGFYHITFLGSLKGFHN